MSFYGNMYLEFQKFFYRFLFQGKGAGVATFSDELKDENKYLTTTNILQLEPQSTHDELVIDTANRWIRMIPHKADDGSIDGVSLFHAQAKGSDGKSISLDTFKLNENNSDKETQLKFGDSIMAHTLNFDEAGHIYKTTSQNYTLPNMTIEIGKSEDKGDSQNGLFKFIPGDDWITLTSKDDTITIGHKDADELEPGSIVGWSNLGASKPDGQISNIDTGSYFSVPKFTYDDRGHITKVESQYYKLPIVEVEAETQALREDVDVLTEAVSDHTVNIATNTTDIMNLKNIDVTNLQDADSQLSKRIGAVDNLDTSLNDASLTGVIGSVKNYSSTINAMNNLSNTTQYSVSDAISLIANKLTDFATDYNGDIRGIYSRLDVIEKKLGIVTET